MSGMDNYGELIDSQEFPVSRSKQSPYLCYYTITPPPWLAPSMKMSGSLTFTDLDSDRTGCTITNAGEISVNWFPISSMVEAAVPNGIKNGYLNFPKVVKKYKCLRDWKWMFHRLATKSGRTVLTLRGPFEDLLEELEEFQTPPLGAAATPGGTISPCSSLDDDIDAIGEIGRWNDDHVVDIDSDAGQRHRGQYRLEPPTHRSFRGNDHRSAPQAIPHLGPMLETTIGPSSRSSRSGTLSPSSTKTQAQTEPDTSKGMRRPSKRHFVILGVIFLLFLNWMGLTITVKHNTPPAPVATPSPQFDYAADYD